MHTEQQTQEHRIVNPRRGRFDTEKEKGWRRHQQKAEQREHHSMNFEC